MVTLKIMGANVSKTVQSITQESISKAVANVVTNQSANCSANATTDQVLNIDNAGRVVIGDISFDSTQDVSFKCVQTLSATTDISTALQTALQQEAKSVTSQLQPLLTANISETDQTVIQKAYSDVATNITTNQVASAITNTLSKQGFSASNVQDMTVGNVSYKIKQTTMTEAIQTLSSVSSAVTTISTQLASKTSAETKQGIDIAGLFSGLFGPIIVVVVVLLLLFLIFPSTVLKLVGGTAKGVISAPGNIVNSFTSNSGNSASFPPVVKN